MVVWACGRQGNRPVTIRARARPPARPSARSSPSRAGWLGSPLAAALLRLWWWAMTSLARALRARPKRPHEARTWCTPLPWLLSTRIAIASAEQRSKGNVQRTSLASVVKGCWAHPRRSEKQPDVASGTRIAQEGSASPALRSTSGHASCTNHASAFPSSFFFYNY